MNKRKCLVPLLLVVCIMAVAIEASTAAPIKARLGRIQGKVEIRLKGSDVWKPASEGLTLDEGATIRCGKDSVAFIIIKGDAVKVGALTQLTLDSLKENADGSTEKKLYLNTGEIHAKVALMDKKSTFSVQTPIAVCGVRGTSFHVSLHDVSVIEGNVYVIANEKEIDVPEGHMVMINDEGAVGPVETIPEQMLPKMKEDDKQCGEAVSEKAKETSNQGKSEEHNKDKDDKQKNKDEETSSTDSATDAAGASEHVDNVMNQNDVNQIVQDAANADTEPGWNLLVH